MAQAQETLGNAAQSVQDTLGLSKNFDSRIWV